MQGATYSNNLISQKANSWNHSQSLAAEYMTRPLKTAMANGRPCMGHLLMASMETIRLMKILWGQ